MMDLDNMTRQELLDQIVSHRKKLEEVLAKVPEVDYFVPVFAGGLTLKDLLAHIVAWEQRMITWLGQAAEGILPDVPASDEAVEKINAEIYLENKDASLEDVRKAFERSYQQALKIAEDTPEVVLFSENLIEGRERPYWITVASNTWWHYKDHYDDLTAWLGSKTG